MIRSAINSGFDWSNLLHGIKAMALAWRRRRMVGDLGALDDRLLADMGITRQDILSVLAEPLYVDPSEKLAERASDARRARRLAALNARFFARCDQVAEEQPRRAA